MGIQKCAGIVTLCSVSILSYARCAEKVPADYSKCNSAEIQSLDSNEGNIARGVKFSRILNGPEFRRLSPDDKISYLSTVPAAKVGMALREILLAYDFHVPPKAFLRFNPEGEVLYDGRACQELESGAWSIAEEAIRIELPDEVMQSVSGRTGPLYVESMSASWWCNAHNGPQVSIRFGLKGESDRSFDVALQEYPHACFDHSSASASLP